MVWLIIDLLDTDIIPRFNNVPLREIQSAARFTSINYEQFSSQFIMKGANPNH
jgi:hypothetical protein